MQKLCHTGEVGHRQGQMEAFDTSEVMINTEKENIFISEKKFCCFENNKVYKKSFYYYYIITTDC